MNFRRGPFLTYFSPDTSSNKCCFKNIHLAMFLPLHNKKRTKTIRKFCKNDGNQPAFKDLSCSVSGLSSSEICNFVTVCNNRMQRRLCPFHNDMGGGYILFSFNIFLLISRAGSHKNLVAVQPDICTSGPLHIMPFKDALSFQLWQNIHSPRIV